MKEKPTIIFMGTPEIAVRPLNALNKYKCDVALVVTQPDRPKGRGRKLNPPAVKETALSLGYEVIQPESIKTDAFIEVIKNISPDFFVVVAYGHILPEKLLKIPKVCAINIHASILPKYRGAAPIQWAIINGEKETGITTMSMDKGMDTGDILMTSKVEISKDDTTQTLGEKLSFEGADLLIQTLEKLMKGELKPAPQDNEKATYAPLLKKKDGCIDWTKPAKDIDALIRGVTPWPGAYTFYNNNQLKILKANSVEIETNLSPGTVINTSPVELCIASGKGAVDIIEVQSPSGKRLKVDEFLRGHTIPHGTVFH